jgi:hypothetical protein
MSAVVARGDRRKSLEAIRDHLAAELEDSPATVAIAPMAKELRAVIEELDSLPLSKEESKVDDLTAKRESRRAAARRAQAADL